MAGDTQVLPALNFTLQILNTHSQNPKTHFPIASNPRLGDCIPQHGVGVTLVHGIGRHFKHCTGSDIGLTLHFFHCTY